PGSRRVNDQLELRRLHDRQVRRLRAFENLSDVGAGLPPRIRNAGSVAHQTADFSRLAVGKRSRNRVARREIDQLDAPGRQKSITGDEKGVRPLARERCKHRFDFLASAGIEDLDLQLHGAGGCFRVSQGGLRIRSTRAIYQHGNASRSWNQLTQDFQPLCHQFAREEINTCHVRTRSRPSLTGSWLTMQTRGIVVVAALAAKATSSPAVAITATWRRTNSAANVGSRSI